MVFSKIKLFKGYTLKYQIIKFIYLFHAFNRILFLPPSGIPRKSPNEISNFLWMIFLFAFLKIDVEHTCYLSEAIIVSTTFWKPALRLGGYYKDRAQFSISQMNRLDHCTYWVPEKKIENTLSYASEVEILDWKLVCLFQLQFYHLCSNLNSGQPAWRMFMHINHLKIWA